MSFLILLIIILIYNFNAFFGKVSAFDKDAVTTRIYLGLEVNEGEYPFIARVHDYIRASIIHKNWILTAGHCLNNKPKKITVGTTSANGTDGQTYDIKNTYVPDNYYVSADVDRSGKLKHYNSDNDIGLIQLKMPIDLTQPNVETIPLDATNSSDYEDQDVVYIGWGQTQIHSYSPADRAQFAQGLVINTTACKKVKPSWVIRSYQHMCMSPLFNATICHGDAGAPLISYETNKQIGIANHGTCGSQLPSVFQRISVHYPWIQETVHKQGDTLPNDVTDKIKSVL